MLQTVQPPHSPFLALTDSVRDLVAQSLHVDHVPAWLEDELVAWVVAVTIAEEPNLARSPPVLGQRFGSAAREENESAHGDA